MPGRAYKIEEIEIINETSNSKWCDVEHDCGFSVIIIIIIKTKVVARV